MYIMEFVFLFVELRPVAEITNSKLNLITNYDQLNTSNPQNGFLLITFN